MEIDTFISLFANLFDDTDPSKIQADTHFHDLDEWSSLLGMSVIAMAKTEFGKTITGAEIRSCITVQDLYVLIESK
ncbi:MAG: acyl carrier protein [Bacteroidales bacterium]|nr:acyl carrier protein [Bacteroidales bacterium]